MADEGFLNACAGDLLRYRKQIGAEHVQIFTDIKKKHRLDSHAHNHTIYMKLIITKLIKFMYGVMVNIVFKMQERKENDTDR